MCKIAVFPFIPEGLESEVLKIARELTGPMTEHDQDGFGYMALGQKGIFGERWLDPADAWSDLGSTPAALADYAGILETPEAQANGFGEPTPRIFSLSLHSRMSTCGYGLENVHPFINEAGTIGLIHNGVISNVNEFKLRLSTCDSEAILHAFEKHDVKNEFDCIHKAISSLQGWYAVSALTQDNAGTWRLNLFKESRSNLYAAVIVELQLPVFITDPTHLEDACHALGYTVSGIVRVRENIAIAIDPLTGKVLDQTEIAPNMAPEVRFNAPELDYRTYREDAEMMSELADDDGPLDTVDFMMRDPFGVKVRKGA